jgi:hypothetical protein
VYIVIIIIMMMMILKKLMAFDKKLIESKMESAVSEIKGTRHEL